MRNLTNTGLLFLFIFLLRFIAMQSLRRIHIRQAEDRRNWRVQINNAATLLLVLGLLLIWAAKLQAFALSIFAIGAALVIATKELIMCFLGGLYKSINRLFKVGDRIEVNGYRGEVMDHNFLVTEVMEIGPGKTVHHFTGKTIIIPNSLFLSNGVSLEAWSANYRLHTFSVKQPMNIDIGQHKKMLLEAAEAACADYKSKAKQYMVEVQNKEAIEAPSTDPRVSIVFTAKDEVEFVVRVPVPKLRTARIEQEIINHYIAQRQNSTS